MPALARPVAAVRVAIRAALRRADLSPGSLVLVACSGGADSLALADQTAFVAPRLGLRAGLLTVDHGLQPGSAARAIEVAAWATKTALAPAEIVTVDVPRGGDGPEAAARSVRYAGLADGAKRHGAVAVLLGHTRDDQAETVLLALARGAGPRGIAGMPASRPMHDVTFLRPLLDVSRVDTRAACAELRLVPWEDPHNQDPRFTRSRVRAALPALVDLLGHDVIANLARTAGLVAEDLVALDAMASTHAQALIATDGTLRCDALVTLPAALRTRVIRSFALSLGAPGGALATAHITAVDALVTDWRGQGAVGLPGGIEVRRRDGFLCGTSAGGSNPMK